MSDVPRTYSTLSAEQQAAVSVWIDSFEASYEYEGTSAFKKAVKAAPDYLRVALVTQLLPSLIDHDRKRQGRTLTLHELRARFPDLAKELTAGYPLLSDGYRLPVELRGYRVLRVVGEGGQALVLRAQDDVHSAVAIKLSSSPEHNELLLRERELLGQCQHPGIPEVITSGVNEDRAFFIMPFLRGRTLADKYATHRPPAEEAARVAAELCSIVEHLHSRGILHRDIKPQNVWIDDSGAVKLIDLGMAIDRSSWGSPRAAVEEFHGTPAFMSPEQATSDGDKDGELSDVFSIGATLYWMLTGVAPFEAEKPEVSLSLAAAGKFDNRLLLASKDYSQTLKRNCLRAMEADPGNRFPSAAAFGATLQQGSQEPSGFRSRKAPLAAAAFVLLLLLTGAVLFVQSGTSSQWMFADSVASPPAETSPASVADERSHEELRPEESIPKPEEVRWIDRVATSQGIDLAAIKPADFKISVRSLVRLIEPWGKQKRGPSAQFELTIHVPAELRSLASVLEFRVGSLPWSKLQATEDGYVATLSPEAADDHGPVEVRLVSDLSGPLVSAVGPFRYEIDVSQALSEDKQAFGQELLKEATTAKCFDVSQSGWAIREEYSRRLTPIITEFWFGTDREGTLTPVSAPLKEQLGIDHSASIEQSKSDLRQAFALASKDIQTSPRLWIKIRFSGGKSFGPVKYEKPLTEAEKDKQRVLAWFERLGPDDELAKFQEADFVLTRLNEVTPSLTHLHFMGTRRFVNGDPTHVRDSKSGDPKDDTIEDKTSSEVVFDLARITGDRTINIPLVWNPVTVKGRFPDGTFTPSFKVRNSTPHFCHCSISPFDASSREADRELYVYIEDDTLAHVPYSILPFVPNPKRLSPNTIEGCKRTRLSLFSPLPAGAVGVEYYSDSKFTDRVESAKPGIIYARYVNADQETVGYSAYKLSDAFMRMWVEHALRHAAGTE